MKNIILHIIKGNYSRKMNGRYLKIKLNLSYYLFGLWILFHSI